MKTLLVIFGIALLYIVLIDDSVFAISIEEIEEKTDLFAHSLASGDFDGDTIQDLAVANFFPNNVSIRLGNGNSTF